MSRLGAGTRATPDEPYSAPTSATPGDFEVATPLESSAGGGVNEGRLTVAELARQYRESLKDKSYRALPLGQEIGHYLRFKRKQLTPQSYRDYEGCLHKLALFFADLELESFEPPVGTERLEEFLEHQWGARAPRTYNKNLSIIHDFFEWQTRRDRLHGDPTLNIGRAKNRAVYRTVFTPDQRRAILAANSDFRDRLALRLILDYGLRKGALQGVQYKHFDHNRRTLTIFTKGGKVQTLPIPHQSFWYDLERLIIETEARPTHYLLPRQKTIPRRFDPKTRKAIEIVLHRFHDKPMGGHGLHSWWYRSLAAAGVTDPGIERGERMHKGRHTAGQRVLDKTGNLKAAQKLLGHSSIQTTGNIYVDWDIDQLAGTLIETIDDEAW